MPVCCHGGVDLLVEVGTAIGFNVVIHAVRYYYRKTKASSENVTQSVYEDPDKLASNGRGNFELTQCPAYESTIQQTTPTTS